MPNVQEIYTPRAVCPGRIFLLRHEFRMNFLDLGELRIRVDSGQAKRLLFDKQVSFSNSGEVYG